MPVLFHGTLEGSGRVACVYILRELGIMPSQPLRCPTTVTTCGDLNGVFAGISTGAILHVALRVAERLGPDHLVVVLLPDGGRGYLSKIFNDEWMADYGFLTTQTAEPKIADVLATCGADGTDVAWGRPERDATTSATVQTRTPIALASATVPTTNTRPRLRERWRPGSRDAPGREERRARAPLPAVPA